MKRTILLLSFFCFSVSVLMAQRVNLTFTPSVGSKYEYSYSTEQHIVQQVMGEAAITHQTYAVVYTMDVLERNADETKLAFVYKEVVYEMLNPMVMIRYNSTTPVENPTMADRMMSSIYSCLIGKEFTVLISSDGSVKSVVGMDTVIDDMMKAIGEPAEGSQMRDQMERQMGNDAMRKSFEQSMGVYPGKPVRVGETWETREMVEVLEMPLAIHHTYKLESVGRNTAKISYNSVVDGGADFISGIQLGTSEMDVKTGMIKESVIQQDLKGNMELYGTSVPVEVLSAVTITVREVE